VNGNDINTFLEFFENCLAQHGRNASVLINACDSTLLTRDHQIKLLSNANFDWRFFSSDFDTTIRRLVIDALRQDAAAIVNQNNYLAEQREEISQLRREIGDLMNLVRMQQDTIVRQSSVVEGNQRELHVVKATVERSFHQLVLVVNNSQDLITTYRNDLIPKVANISDVQQQLRSMKSDLSTIVDASRVMIERNPWIHRGEFTDMNSFYKFRDDYPFARYEWGIHAATHEPEPVIIGCWNSGVRIVVKAFGPHGDHGGSFHIGTAMLTCGTDDSESKTAFYHRYVDMNFRPCCPSSQSSRRAFQFYTRFR
jgi:hypothetical protein